MAKVLRESDKVVLAFKLEKTEGPMKKKRVKENWRSSFKIGSRLEKR